MSIALSLIGFLIFLAGVAWGLAAIGVPRAYVLIAVALLLGIGVFTGVSKMRGKD